MSNLSANARRLARLLERSQTQVVFAESCTGGLVAASLAQVPGISDCLCGSAVTYRNATKHQWLDVSSEDLVRPGPVSAIVAKQMAAGVLAMTPEADWAASVTGHLGPNAPKRFDGLVYIGIGQRTANQSGETVLPATATRHMLTAVTRIQRQREAASLVLQQIFDAITIWQNKQ